MSWQDIGSVGEMISAIAVVFSLIYRAFQIRQNTSQIYQNTEAARASAFDSTITQTMHARNIIIENEDVARIFYQGSIDSFSRGSCLRRVSSGSARTTERSSARVFKR